MTANQFPYAGKSFVIKMNNGLEVKNSYLKDGKQLEVEFLSGDLLGTKMVVTFTWKALPSDNYLISWQESDKSTVVHCDNFIQKKSLAYYTTMKGDFFVMEGVIK
ncbi:hypothetical protein GCM10023211_07260 [Orbus sasakiae]|uniref:MoaF-like domain-containing protein n=1 Tax=Orbus sasakiae TaxID=1078475 RepID=A0ABP9N1C5_9GAMM